MPPSWITAFVSCRGKRLRNALEQMNLGADASLLSDTKPNDKKQCDPPGHETRAISIGIFIYLGDYGVDPEILSAP